MPETRRHFLRVCSALGSSGVVSLLIGGCEDEAGGKSGTPPTPVADRVDPHWPIYRGDAAMRGVAEGKLDEKVELRWTFATDRPIVSSAAIGMGRVFIGSDNGHLYALDFKTGAKAWEFKAGSADPIQAPPTLWDGRILVGSLGGFLYCLDAKDGRELWKFETQDQITGAANVAKLADGREVALFGSYDSTLYALDAGNGELIWKFEAEDKINGTPAISQGKTAFGGCDSALHVVNVADGTEALKVEIGAPIAASVAMHGKTAYFMHQGGAFLAVDMEAGKIQWEAQTHGQSQQTPAGSAAVTDQHAVFAAGKKMVCVNRADGKELWTFAARRSIDSSPVICDGKVVFGSDDGRVYLIRLSDGAELWNYEVGKGLASSPAVAGGWVVIGGMDGTVYAFGPQAGGAPAGERKQEPTR